MTLRAKIGLIAGILGFLVLQYLPAPEGMSPEAWKTATIAFLMGLWWITEPVPNSAVALLPIVLFPMMGISTITKAAAPFADPIIYLFLGGFLLAEAMQHWNLHKRLAISIIKIVGTSPARLVLGFMAASAFLSMWVSNSATTMMMLPIAASVLALFEAEKMLGKHAGAFAISIFLGVAFAASIGGMATLIGTPPNAFLAGFMQRNWNIEIGFVQWMLIGVPLVLITLPVCYVLLAKILYPVPDCCTENAADLIQDYWKKLGPMSRQEKMVAVVFGLTALSWIFRPVLSDVIPGLSDTSIAVIAALTLFFLPSGVKEGEDRFLLDWRYCKELPWEVLILFGGGLSLANMMADSGLSAWIGESTKFLSFVHPFVFMLVSTGCIILLTEITSNSATAAAFVPIFSSVAIGIDKHPLLLTIPIVLGASAAFMLPVATPPNAIVYGTGRVPIHEMIRSGFWLVVTFTIVITLLSWFLVPVVFDVAVMQVK
jgi:sodium-dependent dicarboxylate transporter 2/3/5